MHENNNVGSQALAVGVLVGLLFLILTRSLWTGIAFGVVSGLIVLLVVRMNTSPTRKRENTSWFPSPHNNMLRECHVCGQHDTSMLHACRLWIEPEGNSYTTVRKNTASPARILDEKHDTIWVCSHTHTDRATRRSCAYQHLVLHQNGSCACSGKAEHKTPISRRVHLKRRLSAKATVYIIVNESLNAVKVGIAGESRFRIRNHVKHGWTLYYESPLLPRHHALQAEQYILYQWREIQNLPFGVEAHEMPQNGYTETAPLDKVHLPQVRLMLWEYVGNGNPFI